MASWRTWVGLCGLAWALLAPAAARAQEVFAQEPGPVRVPQFLPPDGEDCPPWNAFQNAFQAVPKRRNAFDEPGCTNNGYLPIKTFGGIGVLGWSRYSLGNGTIAVIEPDNTAIALPNPDTGILPTNVLPAVRFSNVPNPYNVGVQGNVGVIWDCNGLEFAGFHQPRQGGTSTAAAPGQLGVFFYAFPPPFGFTGTNLLWVQADVVDVILDTQLTSGEFNYRYVFGPYCQMILGLRYIECRETFQIRTDDDVLAAGARVVRADPLRQATYITEAFNRILGPQIGIDLDLPIAPVWYAGLTAKFGFGWDFSDVNQRLVRGDGFLGPSGGREDTIVSEFIEVGVKTSYLLNQNMRIEAGYNTFWLINVPVAHQQVNFNPAIAGGTRNNHGSIFFHGPSLKLELNF